MQIFSVNLPKSYLKYINILTDPKTGIYPSRAELCRHAIGVFIERQLLLHDKIKEVTKNELDEEYVRVPHYDKNGERIWKTYKNLGEA